MNTTNTKIAHLQSQITMAYRMLIISLLGTMVQLPLVFIMLTPYYKIATIALLAVTVINVVFISRTAHTLIQS